MTDKAGHKSAAISLATTNQTAAKRRPLTNDITSVEYYDTVFALAESPVNKGTLWQAQMTGSFCYD